MSLILFLLSIGSAVSASLSKCSLREGRDLVVRPEFEVICQIVRVVAHGRREAVFSVCVQLRRLTKKLFLWMSVHIGPIRGKYIFLMLF